MADGCLQIDLEPWHVERAGYDKRQFDFAARIFGAGELAHAGDGRRHAFGRNHGEPPEVQGSVEADAAGHFDAEIPGVKVIVHPECLFEVAQKSDAIGSTEGILKAVRESAPGTKWAVGTELNMVNRMAREMAPEEVASLHELIPSLRQSVPFVKPGFVEREREAVEAARERTSSKKPFWKFWG